MNNDVLIKKLKKAAKNRDIKPYQETKVLSIIKDLPIDLMQNFWVHFALSAAVLDHYIRNEHKIDNFLVLHVIVALIFIATMWTLSFTLNSKPPKKKIDDWLWKKGRKILFLQAILLIEFVFLMPLHYPVEGAINLILYFSAFCYFYYWVLVLTGCARPKLLLSHFWTTSGVIFNYFAFLSFYIWYLTTIPDRRLSIFVMIVVFGGGIYVLWFGENTLKSIIEKDKLNRVQKDIIQIIKPSKLLVALSSVNQIVALMLRL